MRFGRQRRRRTSTVSPQTVLVTPITVAALIKTPNLVEPAISNFPAAITVTSSCPGYCVGARPTCRIDEESRKNLRNAIGRDGGPAPEQTFWRPRKIVANHRYWLGGKIRRDIDLPEHRSRFSSAENQIMRHAWMYSTKSRRVARLTPAAKVPTGIDVDRPGPTLRGAIGFVALSFQNVTASDPTRSTPGSRDPRPGWRSLDAVRSTLQPSGRR